MESAAGPVGPRALASDKLFFSLFQDSPDLVLRWPLEWQVVVICPHRQLNFGPLTRWRVRDHGIGWSYNPGTARSQPNLSPRC